MECIGMSIWDNAYKVEYKLCDMISSSIFYGYSIADVKRKVLAKYPEGFVYSVKKAYK